MIFTFFPPQKLINFFQKTMCPFLVEAKIWFGKLCYKKSIMIFNSLVVHSSITHSVISF